QELGAEPRGGRAEDLVAAGVGLLLRRDERLIRAEAGLALRLAAAGAHPHPLQLALEVALPRAGLLLLGGEPLLLLLQPAGVVPLPRDPLAAVELEDPL